MTEHGAGDREARASCGWSMSATGASSRSPACRGWSSRARAGLLDVVASPDFAGDQLIYLTYSEPSPNGGSGLALARAKLVRHRRRAAARRPHVLWRDPAGGEGGQFGARHRLRARRQVAVPEHRASGSASRPAQDPSQPLGKILHLTLDGKPAPGNPWAGRTGAPTVTVTDPPEDTEAATSAPGRRSPGPARTSRRRKPGALGHRNPPTASPSRRRAAVGDRNGPARRR